MSIKNKGASFLYLYFPSLKRMMLEREYYKEAFVKEQYKFLVKDLRPHTIAYDFGASIGDTALYLARESYIDVVYSYEKSPQIYTWAKENISLSQYAHKIRMYNKSAMLPNRFPKNSIIKCDVEGAEHILNWKAADLRNVYKIEMEYHNGIQNLKETLEAKGFKIAVSKKHNPTKKQGHIGYLYAWRAGSKRLYY